MYAYGHKASRMGTLLAVWMSAFKSSKSRVIAMWPWKADWIKAVYPSCICIIHRKEVAFVSHNEAGPEVGGGVGGGASGGGPQKSIFFYANAVLQAHDTRGRQSRPTFFSASKLPASFLSQSLSLSVSLSHASGLRRSPHLACRADVGPAVEQQPRHLHVA